MGTLFEALNKAGFKESQPKQKNKDEEADSKKTAAAEKEKTDMLGEIKVATLEQLIPPAEITNLSYEEAIKRAAELKGLLRKIEDNIGREWDDDKLMDFRFKTYEFDKLGFNADDRSTYVITRLSQGAKSAKFGEDISQEALHAYIAKAQALINAIELFAKATFIERQTDINDQYDEYIRLAKEQVKIVTDKQKESTPASASIKSGESGQDQNNASEKESKLSELREKAKEAKNKNIDRPGDQNGDAYITMKKAVGDQIKTAIAKSREEFRIYSEMHDYIVVVPGNLSECWEPEELPKVNPDDIRSYKPYGKRQREVERQIDSMKTPEKPDDKDFLF